MSTGSCIEKNLRSVSYIVLGLVALLAPLGSLSNAAEIPNLLPMPTVQDALVLESSQELVKHISAVEWLGPLAPIALSPFFGLACLSGIATYGPDWLQQRSAIFGSSSPLNNPALFWSMVVLTAVTSLPRFSKVSKPIALAVEKLEAYSVVIILIAMRVFGSSEVETLDGVSLVASEYFVAGIGTLPIDVALAIASAINVLVINGVKLFCELVIWLTPIPLIDMIVEATNKALCVALMGLYCWSPLFATVVNLILLTICIFVYAWTQRRIVYYLELTVGPLVEGWLPRWFGRNADGDVVFLAESWNGIPILTRLRLKGSPCEGWRLTRYRWWNRIEYPLPPFEPKSEAGLLAQAFSLVDDRSQSILLHRHLSPD